MGWKIWGFESQQEKIYLALQIAQTGSGTNRASYSMGAGIISCGWGGSKVPWGVIYTTYFRRGYVIVDPIPLRSEQAQIYLLFGLPDSESFNTELLTVTVVGLAVLRIYSSPCHKFWYNGYVNLMCG